MASVLKMSLAFGLFGLVALAAILSWYFTYASSPSYNYSFAGTDASTGAQIRLTANWDSAKSSTKIDFEILDASDPAGWKLYKSANNFAETDAWFGFYNINQGDSAWVCTKTGNGNQDGNTGGAATFSTLGSDLFTSTGNAGGLTYFSIGYTDAATGKWIQKVLIPVVFSSAGITNFGGYAGTTTFGSSTLVSFKTGLPALPSLSTCVDYVSDAESAVVESDTAPVCASFPSLFAFLQKRSYADSAAASFCTGSATAVTCTATTSKSDTLLAWTGTDRAFKCTSAVYGTILSFSGSDDAVDWLRNVAGTSVSFVGMSAHAGFYKKFALWQAYIDSNASTTKTTFNGHSLGGAVANIAAAYWKNKYSAATVAIVTCGAPAAFKAHSAQYTGLVNKRYVNFLKNPWYLPNQRDVVSVVAGVLGFAHPSTAPILSNTKDATNGGAYGTGSISVTAVVGDVDVMGMHTTYTTSMDKARATQSTY